MDNSVIEQRSKWRREITDKMGEMTVVESDMGDELKYCEYHRQAGAVILECQGIDKPDEFIESLEKNIGDTFGFYLHYIPEVDHSSIIIFKKLSERQEQNIADLVDSMGAEVIE